MFGILGRFFKGSRASATVLRGRANGQLERQVSAVYKLLASVVGADQLVLKASKVDALEMMRSPDVRQRLLALQRIVFEDPTITQLPKGLAPSDILSEVEDEIADMLARKTVEDKLERRVQEKMQQRHEEYIKEIKMQVLREDEGPDNAQTLRKYAELERLEARSTSRSALEQLRPASIDEVVGQDRAIKALLSKVASPFPQHVLLYGPPGVGKTTVARLVLEEAKRLPYTPFDADSKFVEVDGSTLRWDPREVSNPLLGSVHDPIYQGARREFADSAVPEPKLGLVTEAHGGILFIDEVGELDPLLQSKLLKVLEDKRVTFDSAYYDPEDTSVPKYIKKLFEQGAPADFVLIGATTRDPSEINPALRSRTAEVFFDPLGPEQIRRIVTNAADKLRVRLEAGVPELISRYTAEGRKTTSILADAYGLALHRSPEGKGPVTITLDDLHEVIRVGRITPNVLAPVSSKAEVGRVLGLGVFGFVGSLIEIEAAVFRATERGKGRVRFNETAGSMAKDSVFNATSLLRRLTGLDMSDFDIHVNIIGGGRIDGPSAGLAILLALISAIYEWPIRQDLAVTGEVSIQGRVRPVGGVHEKAFGAYNSGVRRVLVPADNARDVPGGLLGLEVVAVGDVHEALRHVFGRKCSRLGPKESAAAGPNKTIAVAPPVEGGLRTPATRC